MPSTPNKGYEVQVTGTNVNTWGDVLNDDMIAIVDSNLGGIVTKTLSNAPVVLDATESQNAIVRLIGTLTGNVLVSTLANGSTIVENATSGAFTVTFKKDGVGSAVTIPQGTRALVALDVTNGARTAADNQTEFPAGFKMFTSSSAAPTGWTTLGTNTNRGIRIAGTGGVQGGSAGFTDIFTTRGITGTVGGTAITIAQLAAHTHTVPMNIGDDAFGTEPRAAATPNAATVQTDPTGGGAAHDHSLSINNLNMSLAYVDVMEIQKN
jgi:hypothetical protein